jgi:hypothetical protein
VTPQTSPSDYGAGIFGRLFGIALVAHVVGNWSQPDLPSAVGWVNLAVGIGGAWLVLRPTQPVLLFTSAVTVGSVLLEMPFTGNHWLVAALVGGAILFSWGRKAHFVPAARLIVLVFYSFAAFAKLNSGFFDPSVSCGLFYANHWLDGFGFPLIGPASPLASASIWLTASVEMSIPILLIFRRSRYAGVLLGTGFHTVISFDLNQHFYDFTAVLMALFFLFLPDRTVERIAAATERLSRPFRKLISSLWLVLAGTMVVLATLPPSPASSSLLVRLPFALWIPFSIFWLGLLLWAREPAVGLAWNPRLAGGLIVAIAIANGLTPYTETKTAYGFNMYANLRTAEGVSNHFLVGETFPLRREEYVEIVETTDPGLDLYRVLAYRVAMPQLHRYLANRPEVGLTYQRADNLVEVTRAGDDALLSDPGPWWWRFMALRALDMQEPPRCQDVFLPAL